MRSKGSRFTLGVWGYRCVRLKLSNRPQPSATVRAIAQLLPYGRAYICLCGRFTCQVPSFRVAGVALRDMWTCFVPPLVRLQYGRAYRKFTGVVMFGHFTCHVASFRVAGVALRDMWT